MPDQLSADVEPTDPSHRVSSVGWIPANTPNVLRIAEIAHGHLQWDCPVCRSGGNITRSMIGTPTSSWHRCRGPRPLRSDADTEDRPMTDTTPTDAEAALALLHEGEEPYDDERLVPTPAQWIWQWNRATPDERLSMAALILENRDRLNRCTWTDHERQIAGLREANRRLNRRCQYAERVAARLERAALTGEEQPATGGIITGGLAVVGEGGSNCGTIPPLPGRSQWRGEHGPEVVVNLPRREPGAALADTEAADPHTGLVVGEYRHDHGHKAWVFRCWGDEPSGCDGYLALDKPSEAAALRARNRHVAERHTRPATPSDQEG